MHRRSNRGSYSCAGPKSIHDLGVVADPRRPTVTNVPSGEARPRLSGPLFRLKRATDIGGFINAGSTIAFQSFKMYGECMARLHSTTVRLDEEDVRALKRARAAGHSASDLIRKGYASWRRGTTPVGVHRRRACSSRLTRNWGTSRSCFRIWRGEPGHRSRYRGTSSSPSEDARRWRELPRIRSCSHLRRADPGARARARGDRLLSSQ